MNATSIARARHRGQLSVVLAGLTMIVTLAAAGKTEAAPPKTFLVSPTSFEFGDVSVGTSSAPQVVTVTNVSNVPVVFNGTGGAAGVFGGAQSCQGVNLNPSQSCQFTYTFTPVALGPVTGSTGGTMNGQSYSFTFAGNGIRRFLISPTSIDFGAVRRGGLSPEQLVTITNVSTAPVVMSGAGGAAGVFGGSQDCQGLTMNPGQSCHMYFAFQPTVTGVATGTSAGNWNGQPFNISFTGTGYKPGIGDLDADGKTDLSLYRPGTGQWLSLLSSTNFMTSGVTIWGLSADRPVPGDYDGDGRIDLGLFRPSTGQWLILTSVSNFMSSITVPWGTSTDTPVPGDYDGDGKTDVAVFRPSDGTWYIIKSSTGTPIGIQWGISTDRPVPGDYDGDGKTDIAVFRPSNGTWYIIKSSTGVAVGIPWGISTDLTVQADYDGDGKTDVAVYRNGSWFVINSSTGAQASTPQWGLSTDVPVPADYDGDGKADIAVFRPSDATWYVIRSTTGVPFGIQWGASTDIPLPETALGRWVP